jgi:hypothetical protein
MEWLSLSFIELAWYILSGLIVLVLPGAALIVWLPAGRGDWLERLADAIGLSIGISALVGLGAYLLGAVFTTGMLVAAYGLCLLTLAIRMIVPTPVRQSSLPGSRWRLVGGLAGLFLILAALTWRWFQARALVLPAWVDSVHHVMLVKKFLELGAVPANLAPEIQAPLAYHFGFHLITALFAALAEITPASAVLWFGQSLNALIGLSIYRLSKTLWDDWRPAVLAALLVTFAFQMPAYYVTWGRYTLATGLVVLPLAMAAAVRASRPPVRMRDVLHLLILTAGVALTHLTALLLFAIFVVVLIAANLLTRWNQHKRARFSERSSPADVQPQNQQPDSSFGVRNWLDGLWQPLLGIISGLFLAAPWLLFILINQPSSVDLRVVSPLDTGQADYWQYILYLLGPQHNTFFLGLAGVGMLWAIVRPPTRVLAVWGACLALLTLPWGLRIPPFRPDHMAILLFLPAALLLSGLIFDGVRMAGRIPRLWLRRGVQTLLAVGALALVGWGGWRTRDVINPTTVFTTQADLAAMTWVENNTPPDARFLINTAHWMSGSYRGVDGGYWLSVLTGRASVLPPALYTLAERESVLQITDWAQRAARLTTCDADFWQLVYESGAQYLYVRQGQGSLQPAALASCDGLVSVYRRDGVFIYEILE